MAAALARRGDGIADFPSAEESSPLDGVDIGADGGGIPQRFAGRWVQELNLSCGPAAAVIREYRCSALPC